MNKIYLIGRITSELELKETKNGKYVTTFNLAVDRGTKDNEGNRITDFIKCYVFNKNAENITKYQKKGNKISVVGKLQIDNYTDKNGNNRTTTYVMVEELEFLEKVEKKETKNDNFGKSGWESAKEIEISPDELPFYK